MRNKLYYPWLLLAAGLTLMGLGIWVLLSPFISYLYIASVFSLLASAAGIFEILFSILNRREIHDWYMFLLGGILTIAIAGYVCFNPWIFMILLPPFMGGLFMVKLILFIRNTVSFSRNRPFNWWLFTIGILLLVFISQLALRGKSIEVVDLMALTGVGFVLAGVFRAYLFLKARRLAKDNLFVTHSMHDQDTLL